MGHGIDFSFKQSEKKSHVKIHGELSPEKVHDIYFFLDNSLSSHRRRLIIDLKNINGYSDLGIFLLSSVIRELKRTVQSVGVLGIPLEQENNFENLGITRILSNAAQAVSA